MRQYYENNDQINHRLTTYSSDNIVQIKCQLLQLNKNSAYQIQLEQQKILQIRQKCQQLKIKGQKHLKNNLQKLEELKKNNLSECQLLMNEKNKVQIQTFIKKANKFELYKETQENHIPNLIQEEVTNLYHDLDFQQEQREKLWNKAVDEIGYEILAIQDLITTDRQENEDILMKIEQKIWQMQDHYSKNIQEQKNIRTEQHTIIIRLIEASMQKIMELTHQQIF